MPLEGLIVVSSEQAVAAPFCSSGLRMPARMSSGRTPRERLCPRLYDAAAKARQLAFVKSSRGKNSVIDPPPGRRAALKN
jgi:formyl-CoA transferase